MCPYIRRIQYTYRYRETILRNNAQLIYDLATGCRVDLVLLGVGSRNRILDGLTMPLNGLVLMEDTGLDDMSLRHFRDLVVNDRIAYTA